MKKTNLWCAAFLIAFSLVLLLWVIPNYTSDPQSDLDVRPSFIPNVAAGAILFLACLMLYNSLRRAKAEQEDSVDTRLGKVSFQDIIKEEEKKLIQSALKKCHYNQTMAAKLLMINRRTLNYKIQQYGINELE